MGLDCIFCESLPKAFFEGKNFFSIYDNYPVSEGHSLIISKRHIDNIMEIKMGEYVDFMETIDETLAYLKFKHPTATGFNLGSNAGKSAGQTIMHFHFHIITRYDGDCANPRGGVRNILPGGDWTTKNG